MNPLEERNESKPRGVAKIPGCLSPCALTFITEEALLK
ncbi:rCG44534 [Rattus norvegicus]|uniref:RCG44534 n=1 Tax=Rattus norvegicus TaxID=10116 RepID=A6I5H4_RAT|nr:rCG44534 [Rattus norvegicus]